MRKYYMVAITQKDDGNISLADAMISVSNGILDFGDTKMAFSKKMNVAPEKITIMFFKELKKYEGWKNMEKHG